MKLSLPQPLRTLIIWLFAVPDGRRSVWEIIKWWELRRIPYNLIVGGVGAVSLVLFYFFITQSGDLKPGEDAVEPLALIAAPFMINIAYTAGWIVEGFTSFFSPEGTRKTGPFLLALGVAFSLMVVLAPSAMTGFFWLLDSITRRIRP